MDPRTSIIKVEARLGFNFRRGLSKEGRAKHTPETSQLLKRIDIINKVYAHLDWDGIRNSEAVRSAAERLFNQLGPLLWPDFDEVHGPFPTWLLQPGHPDLADNDLAYLYPRRLSFSNQRDQQIPSRHFYALICLKLCHYHDNHVKIRPTNSAHKRRHRRKTDKDEPKDTSDSSPSQLNTLHSPTATTKAGLRLRNRDVGRPAHVISGRQQQPLKSTQAPSDTHNTHARSTSGPPGSRPTLIVTLRLDRRLLKPYNRFQAPSLTPSPEGRETAAVTNLQKEVLTDAVQSHFSQEINRKRRASNDNADAAAKKSKHMQEAQPDTVPSQMSQGISVVDLTASDVDEEKAIKIEPTTAASDPLSNVFLKLYLDEAAATDDPLGCMTLANLSTRDQLFDEVQAILSDEIGADDTIFMIRVRRADGGVFQGPDVLSMPITRGGKQDMWNTLVQKITGNGVGNGCLRGYVKLRKGAGNK